MRQISKKKYDSITAAAESLNTNETNIRYASKHNKLLIIVKKI